MSSQAHASPIAADGMQSTPDQLVPVAAAGGRISSLDFIRGIAVMGILAANIVAFGQPFAAYMYPDAFIGGSGDPGGWMWVAQFVLIDGKMRGLFTLLFGAGLFLFMEKAWAKGATRWLQARRLFFLLLFGLVHFFFIWRGDILVLYSIAGFVGLVCLRWSRKTQLLAGLVGYVLGALFFLAAMTFPYLIAETEFGQQAQFAESRDDMAAEAQRELDDGAREAEIIRQGSYADFVRHNMTEHTADPFNFIFVFIFETLPLMLIGMAAYRYGVFDGGVDRGRLRKWGWIGVIAGSALTLPIALWAQSGGFTYWGTIAAFMGLSPLPRLPVVLGLAALLAVYGAHAAGWFGTRVKAAGRMAFSNYMGTSLLMLLVFHGWAGGLYGELTRGGLYLVVLATWAIILLWSKPWLDRYRYGPLEWLWRCLTYGRMFAIRR